MIIRTLLKNQDPVLSSGRSTDRDIKMFEIREYKEYKEEEILKLYAAVGWSAYTENIAVLREAYAHSLLILGAYEDDRLIGIVRAVGDGATIVFVQDILVHPGYQRQGTGKALLQAVLDRYPDVRQIELVSDDTPQTLAFYEALGFSRLSERGCCGFIKNR